MQISEMIYVIDKQKDCITKRSAGLCDNNCKSCECYLDPSTSLDALERIANLISNIDRNSTRKGF